MSASSVDWSALGLRVRGEVSSSSVGGVWACKSERAADKSKRLHVFVADDGISAERQRKIAADNRKIAALRDKPGILPVYEVTETRGRSVVVYEAVTRTAMDELLDGRIPVALALRYASDVARGLKAAHSVGVIHRNITPRAIALTSGGAKLFAFAMPPYLLVGDVQVVGTPATLAPELGRGDAPDERSDAYALGATLFWMLTGEPLFNGSDEDIITAQQKRPVPSLASLVPGAGIAVVDILYRLLQKDRERRLASMAEALELLEHAAARVGRDSQLPGQAHVDMLAGATLADRSDATGFSGERARAEIAKLEPKSEAPRVSSPFDSEFSGSMQQPFAAQPTGVMGSLKQMSVIEIMQTLELGKKSARVDVQVTSGERATFFVHDGAVVHAVLHHPAGAVLATGEPAVGILVKKTDGFFRIHYEKEPCERTIHKPTQFLLLDAMRQIDEGTDASSEVPSATASMVMSAMANITSGEGKWPLGDSPFVSGEMATTALQEQLPATSDSGATHILPVPDLMATTRIAEPTLQHEIRSRRGALRRGLEAIRTLLARVSLRFSMMTDTQTAALTALLPLVVVGVAIAATPRTSSVDALALREQLDSGAPEAVIDALLGKARSPNESLWLGHAYVKSGDPELALWHYRDAVLGGASDDRLARELVLRLSDDAPDDAMDLLVLWPDDAIDDALVEATTDANPATRSNASLVLAERGAIGRIPLLDVMRLDLNGAARCQERRAAYFWLSAKGESLPSLEALAQRNDNGCFWRAK